MGVGVGVGRQTNTGGVRKMKKIQGGGGRKTKKIWGMGGGGGVGPMSSLGTYKDNLTILVTPEKGGGGIGR